MRCPSKFSIAHLRQLQCVSESFLEEYSVLAIGLCSQSPINCKHTKLEIVMIGVLREGALLSMWLWPCTWVSNNLVQTNFRDTVLNISPKLHVQEIDINGKWCPLLHTQWAWLIRYFAVSTQIHAVKPENKHFYAVYFSFIDSHRSRTRSQVVVM